MVDETRVEKILSHLAVYRVSIREILENHLFGGRGVGRELWELSRERGLVTAHQVLSRRRSYYQLTVRGATQLGLSEHWARPLGAQSLIANLSLAWFCCRGKLERRRIDRGALAERLGVSVPGGYYCVERDEGRFRAYRVYVPMPGTRVREILRATRELVEKSRGDAGLRELIESRTYGFAVLLETPMRADALRDRLQTADSSGPSLRALAHFRVESVPDFVATRGTTRDAGVLQAKENGQAD